MDAETRKAAIDAIARHALAARVVFDVTTDGIDWGDYPELVERDFEAVVERVEKIATSIQPTDEAYRAAYRHLTGKEAE